jgi:hypothetical protein
MLQQMPSMAGCLPYLAHGKWQVTACYTCVRRVWISDYQGELTQVDLHTLHAQPLPNPGSKWGDPIPGPPASDGTPVAYCAQDNRVLYRIQGTTATRISAATCEAGSTPSHLHVCRVLSCSTDGSLLVVGASQPHDRLYHVARGGVATPIGKGPVVEFEQEEDSDRLRDHWLGCTWGIPSSETLLQTAVTPQGHLVALTHSGALIWIQLEKPVPPAYLQQPAHSLTTGLSISAAGVDRIGQDFGALLASGEGADVELRCAEGAVVKAHSAVLLARWEYYRVLQRNIAAGMTGHRAAGEVDVSEHSAATVQLILQHLYTGRVQLQPSGVEEAGADTRPAAAAGSNGSSKASVRHRAGRGVLQIDRQSCAFLARESLRSSKDCIDLMLEQSNDCVAGASTHCITGTPCRRPRHHWPAVPSAARSGRSLVARAT